jgi:hypothetical protein
MLGEAAVQSGPLEAKHESMRTVVSAPEFSVNQDGVVVVCDHNDQIIELIALDACRLHDFLGKLRTAGLIAEGATK